MAGMTLTLKVFDTAGKFISDLPIKLTEAPQVVRFHSGNASEGGLNVSIDEDGVLEGELKTVLVGDGEGKRHRFSYARNWRSDLPNDQARFADDVFVDIGNSVEIGGNTVLLYSLDEPEGNTTESLPLFKRLLKRADDGYERIGELIYPNRTLSKRQTKSQEEDLTLVHSGARRFPDLIKKLACVVNEPEVEEVERRFLPARKFTRRSLTALIFLATLVLAFEPVDSPRLSSWAWIFGTATLLLVLRSSFLSAVGSAIFVIVGLLVTLVLKLDLAPGELNIIDGIVMLALPLLVCIGFYLEVGWCPIPRSDRSYFYDRSTMTLSGIGLVVMASAEHELTTLPRVVLGSIGALVLVWTLVITPMNSRLMLATMSSDSITLLSLAWTRWRRRFWSKATAIILSCVPLISFLHYFGESGLSGVPNEESILRSEIPESGGDSYIWVWREHHRLLRESDLKKIQLVGGSRDAWLAEPSDIISEEGFLEVKASQRSRLLSGTHRIDTVEKFLNSVDRSNEKESLGPGGVTLWTLRDSEEDGCESFELKPNHYVRMTWSDYNHAASTKWMYLLPSLLMAALGVLILWRAEGRGWLGYSAAFHCFGFVACASAWVFSGDGSSSGTFMFLLENLFEIASESKETSLLARLGYPLLMLCIAIGWGIFLGWVSGVWQTLLVALWIRPDLLRNKSVIVRGMRTLAFLCIPVAIAVAAEMLGQEFDVSGNRRNLVQVFIAILIPVCVGMKLYRGQAVNSPARKRTSIWLLGILIVPGLLAAVMLLRSETHFSWPIELLFAGGLAALLLATMVVLLLIKNIWNLAGGRTISSVIAILMMPFAIELLQGVILGTLQQAGLFPAAAITIVSVFLGAILFDPIRNGLLVLIRKISLPESIRNILSHRDDLVEAIVRTNDVDCRQCSLKELLEKFGLQDFAVYSRWGEKDGEYRCVISDMEPVEPWPVLNISKRLQGRLAQQRSVLNVERAMIEFEYVLDGPELWRIREKLGYDMMPDGEKLAKAGNLVCVPIGSVLCSFIIIREQSKKTGLKEDGIIDRLREVTAVAAR